MSKGRPDWFKCYKISPLAGFNESLWCYNVEPRFGWNGRVWSFFCSFLSTSLPLLLRFKCQWIQKTVTKMGTWEEPFSLGSSDNDLELRSVFCIFCKHVYIHLPVVTIVAVLYPCTIPYHRHHLDETACCTHPLCFFIWLGIMLSLMMPFCKQWAWPTGWGNKRRRWVGVIIQVLRTLMFYSDTRIVLQMDLSPAAFLRFSVCTALSVTSFDRRYSGEPVVL